MKLTALIILVATIACFAEDPDLIRQFERDPNLTKKLGLHKLTTEEKAEWNRVLLAVYASARTNSAGGLAPVVAQAAKDSSLKIWLSKADLGSEEIIKLDNGAIFEISGRFIGVGIRREVALIEEGSQYSLWVKGKRIFRGTLLRPPAAGRPHGARRSAIDKVSSNGEIVTMADGSAFQVDSLDQIETALWLPATEVFILDNRLILNEEGLVEATPIR